MAHGSTDDRDAEQDDSDMGSQISFGGAADDDASEPDAPPAPAPTELPTAMLFSRDADEADDVPAGFNFNPAASSAALGKRSSNVVSKKASFEKPQKTYQPQVPTQQDETETAPQAAHISHIVVSLEHPMLDADNEGAARASSAPNSPTLVEETAAVGQEAGFESDVPASFHPLQGALQQATTQSEIGAALDNPAYTMQAIEPAANKTRVTASLHPTSTMMRQTINAPSRPSSCEGTLKTHLPASDRAGRVNSISQQATQSRIAPAQTHTTRSNNAAVTGNQHVRAEEVRGSHDADYGPPDSSGTTTVKNAFEHISGALADVRAKADRERDTALHKLELAEQRCHELAEELDEIHQQYANEGAHHSQELAEHKAEVDKLKRSFAVIVKRNNGFSQQLIEMQEAAKSRNSAIRAHKKEAHGIHDAQRLLIVKQAEMCEHARDLIHVMLHELTKSSHQTDNRQIMMDFLEAELDSMAGLLHKARDDLSFAQTAQADVVRKEEVADLVKSVVKSVTKRMAKVQPREGSPSVKPDIDGMLAKLETILKEIRQVSDYQPDADTILDGVAGIVEDQISSDSANVGHQLQDILSRLTGEAASRERIAALEKEVQDAAQRANTVSEEKTSLATKSALMEENISLLKEKIAQLEKNDELARAHEDNALLQAELDLATDRADQARAQVSTMEKERLEGWAEEQKKSEHLAELEAREQDLEARVEELEVQHRDLEVAHEQSLAELSAKHNARIEDLLRDSFLEAIDLQDNIEELQTQAAERQEHINDLTTEVDALRKEAAANVLTVEHNDKLRAENDDLHSKIEDLMSERSALEADVEQYKGRAEDGARLQDELDAVDDKYVDLLTLYEAQRTSIAAREKEHAGEVQILRNDCSAHEEEIATLVREKTQIEEDLEKALEGNVVINERLAFCEIKLADTEKELTQAKLGAASQNDSFDVVLAAKEEEMNQAKTDATEQAALHEQELAAKAEELAQFKSDTEGIWNAEKNNYLMKIQILEEQRDALLKEIESLEGQQTATEIVLSEAQQSVMDKQVAIDQLKNENRKLEKTVVKAQEHLEVAIARNANLEALRDDAGVAHTHLGQDTLNAADFDDFSQLPSSRGRDEIESAVDDAAALLVDQAPALAFMSQPHDGSMFDRSESQQKQIANTSSKLLDKPTSIRLVTPAPLPRPAPKTPDGHQMSMPAKSKDPKRTWKDLAELEPSSDFIEPGAVREGAPKLTQKTSARQQSQHQAILRLNRNATNTVSKTVGLHAKTGSVNGSNSKKRKYEERFDMELVSKRR